MRVLRFYPGLAIMLSVPPLAGAVLRLTSDIALGIVCCCRCFLRSAASVSRLCGPTAANPQTEPHYRRAALQNECAEDRNCKSGHQRLTRRL
jgi:hypothetical protein